jgi:uncharacterized protein YigE (DUF2233 family)
MTRRLRALVALALLAAVIAGRAAGDGYTVIRIDTTEQDLRLAWRDEAGVPFRRFDALAHALRTRGERLVFGMNAGMYEADAAPVGPLVIDGVTLHPLNRAHGSGNFFLEPNGVFLVSAAGPRVVAAADYAGVASGVRIATQSGPLLLQAGRIHPAFRPGSSSRLIRNGVCASGSSAIFVISERPVNFHEFASYFRDALHCRDALYLDGVVSSLYASDLGRDDRRAELGPLFAVVARP